MQNKKANTRPYKPIFSDLNKINLPYYFNPSLQQSRASQTHRAEPSNAANQIISPTKPILINNIQSSNHLKKNSSQCFSNIDNDSQMIPSSNNSIIQQFSNSKEDQAAAITIPQLQLQNVQPTQVERVKRSKNVREEDSNSPQQLINTKAALVPSNIQQPIPNPFKNKNGTLNQSITSNNSQQIASLPQQQQQERISDLKINEINYPKNQSKVLFTPKTVNMNLFDQRLLSQENGQQNNNNSNSNSNNNIPAQQQQLFSASRYINARQQHNGRSQNSGKRQQLQQILVNDSFLNQKEQSFIKQADMHNKTMMQLDYGVFQEPKYDQTPYNGANSNQRNAGSEQLQQQRQQQQQQEQAQNQTQISQNFQEDIYLNHKFGNKIINKIFDFNKQKQQMQQQQQYQQQQPPFKQSEILSPILQNNQYQSLPNSLQNSQHLFQSNQLSAPNQTTQIALCKNCDELVTQDNAFTHIQNCTKIDLESVENSKKLIYLNYKITKAKELCEQRIYQMGSLQNVSNKDKLYLNFVIQCLIEIISNDLYWSQLNISLGDLMLLSDRMKQVNNPEFVFVGQILDEMITLVHRKVKFIKNNFTDLILSKHLGQQ